MLGLMIAFKRLLDRRAAAKPAKEASSFVEATDAVAVE